MNIKTRRVNSPILRTGFFCVAVRSNKQPSSPTEAISSSKQASPVQGLQPPNLKHMQTLIMCTQPQICYKLMNRTKDWMGSNQNFRLYSERTVTSKDLMKFQNNDEIYTNANRTPNYFWAGNLTTAARMEKLIGQCLDCMMIRIATLYLATKLEKCSQLS